MASDVEPIEMENTDFSETRVVNDDNTKIAVFTTVYQPDVENPMWVYNADGQRIGSAVVSLEGDPLDYEGHLKIKLLLDHHTPERLDYELNPNGMLAEPELVLKGGVLSGRVVLSRRYR